VKEVKCEHCGFWTNGLQTHCNYCAQMLHSRDFSEREQLEKVELKGLPFVKINPEDPFITRGFKHCVRFLQLIFTTLISMIAAMASSTVH
jgi:hypothetical protein